MTENEARKILVDLAKDDKRIYAEEYKALNKAIFALEEIQPYRAFGTVEELKSMKENGAFTGVELASLACMQMKLKDYHSIGTVEEFKALKDKAEPTKPLGGADIDGNEYRICRECAAIVEDGEWRADYCPDCGCRIDWTD